MGWGWYHSTLGVRVIKKKKKVDRPAGARAAGRPSPSIYSTLCVFIVKSVHYSSKNAPVHVSNTCHGPTYQSRPNNLGVGGGRPAGARAAGRPSPSSRTPPCLESEFFIDNRLVRIHLIIVMIRRAGAEPQGRAVSEQLCKVVTYTVLTRVQGQGCRVRGLGCFGPQGRAGVGHVCPDLVHRRSCRTWGEGHGWIDNRLRALRS